MNSLMEKILKNSTTKYTSVLDESEFFNNKDCITTDLPILNIAFAGDIEGGMSSGLTLLAGNTKTFKTNLALVCIRSYLNKYPEAIAVFYDSEGGSTPDYLRSQGVDPKRVVHIPIEHLEMLKFDMVKQLKEINRGDKAIFLIDSIGNTASLKELQDALDEKTVAEMQRAKVIKGLFRMVTPSLVNKDIPCIAICHTYDSMDLYSKPIISGGCLVEGSKILMSDGLAKDIDTIEVGEKVKTLLGDKKVTSIWNPETLLDGTPECIRIQFDNGYTLTCSENHKFLVNEEWVEAKDLDTNMDIKNIFEY